MAGRSLQRQELNFGNVKSIETRASTTDTKQMGTCSTGNPMPEVLTQGACSKKREINFSIACSEVKLNVSIDSQQGSALIFYAHAFSLVSAIQLKTKSCKGCT